MLAGSQRPPDGIATVRAVLDEDWAVTEKDGDGRSTLDAFKVRLRLCERVVGRVMEVYVCVCAGTHAREACSTAAVQRASSQSCANCEYGLV